MCGTKRNHEARGGFTLLEILLALSLLTIVMTVTFLTFSAASNAWRRGTELAEDLHHGDFVIDQLVMGLRSAYYSAAAAKTASCGFWLEDHGDGPDSSDVISWVKLGSGLVGANCAFADSPHRVKFCVEDGPDGKPAATVRAWRIYGQPEGFDPEQDVKPIELSRRVIGFNCRPMDPVQHDTDQEVHWLDTWDDTNTIPSVVEVTLFLAPLKEGEAPVEVRRVVDLPVAPLSQAAAASSAATAAAGATGAAGTVVPGQPAIPGVSIPTVTPVVTPGATPSPFSTTTSAFGSSRATSTTTSVPRGYTTTTASGRSTTTAAGRSTTTVAGRSTTTSLIRIYTTTSRSSSTTTSSRSATTTSRRSGTTTTVRRSTPPLPGPPHP